MVAVMYQFGQTRKMSVMLLMFEETVTILSPSTIAEVIAKVLPVEAKVMC